jgi:SOS response regulatory protein OraA/RecX
MQRKFSRAQIDWALGAFYSQSEELRVAKLFFSKQKAVHAADLKEKQRLMQKFLRRGFSPQIVYKVMGASPADAEGL